VPLTTWRVHFDVTLQPINRSKYGRAALDDDCLRSMAQNPRGVHKCSFPERRVASGQLGDAPATEFLVRHHAGSKPVPYSLLGVGGVRTLPGIGKVGS
jgi:hypothetical protein